MPMKAHKYRIYPTKAQIRKFEQTLDICCELYNAALQERRDAWRIARKNVRYLDQSRQLPELKIIREELKDVYAQALQDALKRLDKAFDGFFRRVKAGEKPGYPRFRSRLRYNSFTYPQPDHGFNLKNGKLKLSRIGLIKINLHRPMEGKVKTLTITRSATGKWYACFIVEFRPEPIEPPSEHVGIDVGLEKFAALSNGESIENPRFFRKEEKALAKAQKKLSAATKGSPKRKKRRKVVARIHERIANRRRNFAHQESRKLVNRFGFIVFENLSIRNMLKNHKLAKSISDAAWGQLVQFTTYKAAWAGRSVVLVDPRNTSKKCSHCGAMVEKDLSIRIHDCSGCSLVLDRDVNAARNILALGLQSLGLSPSSLAYA